MKKLLVLGMFAILGISLMACDLLSTIQAVKGFYQEYNTYSEIYADPDHFTVLTETELVISDTNVEGILPVDSRLYFEVEKASNFMYVEQRYLDIDKASIYEDAEDLYVEYIIEGNVATPTIPEGEAEFDTDVNIMNENFSYENVSNENKTGDHTYEFDVYLNQAINLDSLSDFLDQLKVFDESLAGFDNAIAHVVISFTEQDSLIEVDATVTDYRIDFADEQYIVFSLTNHTILSIPEDFVARDVFGDDYQMVAVDDIRLARKAYGADEVIAFPVTAGENGYIKLELEAGEYELVSDYLSQFSDSQLMDETQVMISVDQMNQVELTGGTYYFYLVPTGSFTLDLVFEDLNPAPVTSETTTTETTTETTTTENTNTSS